MIKLAACVIINTITHSEAIVTLTALKCSLAHQLIHLTINLHTSILWPHRHRLCSLMLLLILKYRRSYLQQDHIDTRQQTSHNRKPPALTLTSCDNNYLHLIHKKLDPQETDKIRQPQ